MKKTKNIKNIFESGISLPFVLILSLACSGILLAYLYTIYDKDWQVEYQIAKTKAMYNAESVIALSAYTKLYRKDHISSSEDSLSNIKISGGMGTYSVGLFVGINE